MVRQGRILIIVGITLYARNYRSLSIKTNIR